MKQSDEWLPMGKELTIEELTGIKLTRRQTKNVERSIEILARCEEFGRMVHPQT